MEVGLHGMQVDLAQRLVDQEPKHIRGLAQIPAQLTMEITVLKVHRREKPVTHSLALVCCPLQFVFHHYPTFMNPHSSM